MNNNNPNNKSVAEIISNIKDYADCADVAYAFYDYVDNNEHWSVSDEFYNYKILNTPNSKWIYADGIKFGDIITSKNETKLSQNNNRELGSVTAYALATEARFMQDKTINVPLDDDELDILNQDDIKPEQRAIKNDIKNFIKVNKKTKQQRIFINELNPETNKPYHQISSRTKSFVNRFELINHIPNTLSGYSSTTFYDNLNNKYIISFRGTETKLNDLAIADGLMGIYWSSYNPANYYE